MSTLEYLRVFGWTCGFEAFIYLPLLLLKNTSLKRSIGILLAANFATHPLVTFFLPGLAASLGLATAGAVVLKEVFAPTVEAIVIRRLSKLSWTESIAVSFAANLFSWWAGASLAERLF